MERRRGDTHPQAARGHRIHRGHHARNQRLEASCEKVPVEPFRERFLELRERGEMNMAQLCIYMGWVYRPSPERLRAERRRPGTVKPDVNAGHRTLGIRRRPDCKYGKTHVTYATAERLMKALGMDPHEAGI